MKSGRWKLEVSKLDCWHTWKISGSIHVTYTGLRRNWCTAAGNPKEIILDIWKCLKSAAMDEFSAKFVPPIRPLKKCVVCFLKIGYAFISMYIYIYHYIILYYIILYYIILYYIILYIIIYYIIFYSIIFYSIILYSIILYSIILYIILYYIIYIYYTIYILYYIILYYIILYIYYTIYIWYCI